MRALIQRVAEASVAVREDRIAFIGLGLVVLVGISRDDTERDVHWIAEKVVNLRIFEDEAGKFNRSALEVGADLLVIPQFTLYADARRGRRPDFIAAARPETAEPLFLRLCEVLEESGLQVEKGRFQAHMLVNIHNDGPVTIWIDSRE